MATIFTIPIEPSGSITCTTPQEKVYLLTFISPPDNRLRTNFCNSLLLALDIIEHSHPKGVVVTTSGIPKFYSNGLDLEHATTTPGFWDQVLYPLWRRLLTYPMPTVALINGHAFAGGLMLSMFHDYRVQNPAKGFLCLNELEFGSPLKPPMASIFREKLPYPATYRNMVLEARRFTAQNALKEGIIDGLGGLDEALQLINQRNLIGKSKSASYRSLKQEMYRETIGYLDGHQESEERSAGIDFAEGRMAELERERIRGWGRVSGSKAMI
ncbi:hypothetical protein GP486_002406 [Trichoglossum hirsutum]|uniref:Enoyl-CoA hydratase/isomerase n=1 Tax=Trichoglossum hirsutum TaxID=265104 RepID=A0A9P8RRR9_9PEZI|nr:hypothetical protein GP486_002406 [Trichoglossum hirsutum]